MWARVAHADDKFHHVFGGILVMLVSFIVILGALGADAVDGPETLANDRKVSRLACSCAMQRKCEMDEATETVRQ